MPRVLAKRFVRLSCALAALAMAWPAAAQDDGEVPKSVLAVVAHPDDELFFAPALAALARGGAAVRIVYATRGDRGPGVSGLPRGAELARVRTGEAECASAALGLPAPQFLDFGDGTLADHVRGDTSNILLAAAAQAIAAAKPDLVISWGPDGGYGHPDHRIISAIVTQLVQAMPASARPGLIYTGIAADTLPPVPELQIWAVTAPDLLDRKIAYRPQDLARAHAAMQCHQTQFAEPVRAGMMPLFDQSIWKGAVPFRTLFGG